MKKRKFQEPTAEELKSAVALFISSTQLAYKNVVHNNYYTFGLFWEDYKQMYDQLTGELSEEQKFYFFKTHGLHLFYQLDLRYKKEISDVTARLLQLEPSYKNILKALFLILDFGDEKSPIIDVEFTAESIESVKRILKATASQTKKNKSENYSVDLFNACLQLLRAYTERLQLQKMTDLYIRDDFSLFQSKPEDGYDLKLIDEKSKSDNLYILNELKSRVKRSHKKLDSKERVSELEHFQKNDSTVSSENLTVVFHNSNAKITSTSKGTNAMQIDDSIFELMASDDPAKQQEGFFKMELIRHEQHFHYNFREVLSEIYQPNEEIDIHTLHIKIDKDEFLTLYELLAAAGALTSFSNSFDYFSSMMGLSDVRRKLSSAIKSAEPELNQEEVFKKCDSIIAAQLPEIEKLRKDEFFIFLSKEKLVSILRKVEELKSKPKKQLEKIVQILAGFNNSIPYNIIYDVDGEYYFSYKTCAKQNVVRDIYDYYITDRLFNSSNKALEERKIIDEIQTAREVRVTNSLKNLLQDITPYAAHRLEFPDKDKKYDFGELRGDTDVVAYFEEENLLLCIQVKLSNRPSFKEKRKLKWIEDKIEGEATRQVSKDAILYRRKAGLRFLKDSIGFPKEIPLETLRIHHLIVTDNFFADHDVFEYGEDGKPVFCVSLFEIENLINGVKVHPEQESWESVKEKKSGLYLINIIESNCFWNFIHDFAGKYSVLKSLKYVDAKDRIHLKI